MQGFLSIMKLIIFFTCISLVHSGFHSFVTTYIEISGETTAGIPEFSAVTTLDGHQIDYYDSDTKKLIPKQDWMKEFTSDKRYTEIREKLQQIYKLNIHEIMKQFNQSQGLHTYQRMYGCGWDDETGERHGFDQHGYDGEDFILLYLKERRYITPVPQAELTVMKWNNDRERLESLNRYYYDECVYWLQKFLPLMKVDLKRRAPEVFLLQKDHSYPLVMCHATGFYPSGVTINWLRNGVDHYEDVAIGELLPNEDETFQKTSYLRITPDEWKKNQYTCEVEHQGKTIQKTMTEDEIWKSGFTIVVFVFMGLFILFIGAAVYKKRMSRYNKFKPVPSESEEEVYIDKGL